MWPLDSAAREYLRVGRERLERWSGRFGRLDCVAQWPLPMPATELVATANAAALEAALRILYAFRPTTAVTLLVESALMPTLLVEAGPDLWTPAQMQRLLRHRLRTLYAKPGATTEDWDLRMDFLAGESHGLGFAVDSALGKALVKAGVAAGIECRAMQPALAWGLDRLQLMRHLPARGWLAWAEQDRLLLARVATGRVKTLNAAATFSTDSSTILRQVQIEQLRCGVATGEAVVATTWGASSASRPADIEGLAWLDIGREFKARAKPVNAFFRNRARQP